MAAERSAWTQTRRGSLAIKPGGFQVVEGLVDAADDHAVADRHEDHIRRLELVLLVDLQPDGLLPLDGQGMIGGVAVEAALARGVFEREPEGVIVGAAHGNDAGAVEHHLHELGLGRVFRDEDDRLLARGGADGGEGAGGIAGRGGDDSGLLQAVGLGDDEEGGAVFERGAGVEAVVLEPDVIEAERFAQRGQPGRRACCRRRRAGSASARRRRRGSSPGAACGSAA